MKTFKRLLIMVSVISAVLAVLLVVIDFLADKVVGIKRFKTYFAGHRSATYVIDNYDGPEAIFISNRIRPDQSYLVTGALGLFSVITGAIAFIADLFIDKTSENGVKNR